MFLPLGLLACQELTIDTQPDSEPRLDTDLLSGYEVNAENPRKITFNISSTVPWHLVRSEEANWCVVTPAASSLGSLTAEVSVEVSENLDYAGRSVGLELHAEGMEEVWKTLITQKARSRFTVHPIETEFGVEGGTQSFTILSNTSWEVRSDKPWVSIDKVSGEASDEIQTIQVTIGASTGTQRKAVIYVTPGDGSAERSFEIVQKGIRLEWGNLTSTSMDIPAEGQTLELQVDANIPWDVVSDDTALKIKKSGENKVEMTMGCNDRFKAKTAVVRLIPTAPEHSAIPEQKLTLKQAVSHVLVNGKPVYGDDGSVTLDNTGGRARFATSKGHGAGIYTWKFKSVDLKGSAYIDLNLWPVVDTPCNAFLHFYVGGNDGGGDLGAGGVKKSEFRSAGTILNVADGTKKGMWKPSSYFDLDHAKANAMKELKISILPTAGANMEVIIAVDGVELLRDNTRSDYWKLNPDHLLTVYFGLPSDASGEVSSITIESFQIEDL